MFSIYFAYWLHIVHIFLHIVHILGILCIFVAYCAYILHIFCIYLQNILLNFCIYFAYCAYWLHIVVHIFCTYSAFILRSFCIFRTCWSPNKSSAITVQSHFPCWITLIALSRQFAFLWIIYRHPSHRIPVLCFHLLVLMDFQQLPAAALYNCEYPYKYGQHAKYVAS